MKTLVIVESPTKAKTIKKFFGTDTTVTSSFGHVRDLPKSKMGIDIEGGTFEPTYKVPRDKSKHVKELKALAKKADRIVFATDSDREGEAISWHLASLLEIDEKKAERIVFHEITKSAIEKAFEKPRHINKHLVDAQQARRVLDRLVGYELSPLLWKKITRGLSAGRVQSVVLRLVVEREREIQAFNPEEYWTLQGEFHHKDQTDALFTASLHSIDDKKLDKLEINNQKQIDGILKDLDGASYSVKELTKRDVKRQPPAPFTTSTLQQRAHNQHGYSSKQIMRLAQQLYEGVSVGSHGQVGLITYMRTDSTNLSEKFLKEATDFIASEYGKDMVVEKTRTYKTKSKGAQEAHEAIRPTDPTLTPDSIKEFLTPQQYNLYDLIWRRAVATQMIHATLSQTRIDIAANKYTFRASGQSMVSPGWLTLYPKKTKETMLPELKEKDPINCKGLKPEQHFTEPPPRYSDASLVKALEEYGIGRPSTYAPTIATIEARDYVIRTDSKRLQPTSLAMIVNDLLVEHFPNIVDYQFTAKVEDDFDKIAHGKLRWQTIIKAFYGPFHKRIEEKEKSIDREDVVHMRELGTDEKTGKPIYVRVGRYGPFVQLGSKDDEEKPRFAALEKGQLVDTITLEEALVLLSLPREVGTTEDGEVIKANRGRFGPYLQVKKSYFSLKEDSPYTVTEDRAREIIAAKIEEDKKKHIKSFEGTSIEILNGRYGPYVKDTEAKKNARIPKDQDPAALTLEECQKLLEEAPTRRRGRRGGKKKSS